MSAGAGNKGMMLAGRGGGLSVAGAMLQERGNEQDSAVIRDTRERDEHGVVGAGVRSWFARLYSRGIFRELYRSRGYRLGKEYLAVVSFREGKMS